MAFKWNSWVAHSASGNPEKSSTRSPEKEIIRLENMFLVKKIILNVLKFVWIFWIKYIFTNFQLFSFHFIWYFSSIFSSLLFIQPFSWIALEGKIWENIIFWERWGKTFLWEGKYTNVFPHIFTLKSFFFEDIFFFIYPAYILHHEIEETWEVLLR